MTLDPTDSLKSSKVSVGDELPPFELPVTAAVMFALWTIVPSRGRAGRETS